MVDRRAKKPGKEIKERVNKLRQVIDRHRYLYHVEDRQEISEKALDSLKYELSKIEEEYPELITPDSPTQRVAGEPLKKFQKVKHAVPQWSFNDAFTPDDVRGFDLRTKRFLKKHYGQSVSPSYTCELKIDGLKIVLSYKKGSLMTAATRGDGTTGEDVTSNVRTINSVPLLLKEKVDIVVEGEIWMSKQNLDRLNRRREKDGLPLFTNPRNVAAGSIRQLDPKIVAERKLDSFIYDIAWSSSSLPDTQYEELKEIKRLGFKINKNFSLCRDIEGTILYWQKNKNKFAREKYLVDGVVIKVNEKKYQEILGYTGKAPRYALAFKFPAEQVTTVLEAIDLQVGRTGVITPIARLRPVSIAGSTVSRATLHNEDEIKRLDVRVGDTIILEKAGDVIPKVVRVLKEMRKGDEKKFVFPSFVKSCGGDGRIERVPGEAAYRCVDRNSPMLQRRKFYHFVSKGAFDIEHLGPKVIDLLLDEGLIDDYADIFTLEKGDVINLPRFGEKSADNLLSAIESKGEIELSRLLVALSIDHVGEETSEEIARHFSDTQEIRNATKEEFSRIPGIGDVIAESLHKWFRDKKNRQALDKLLKEIRVIKKTEDKKSGLFLGKKFVFTGALQTISRNEAGKKVKSLGGSVSGTVSKNTDYLISGQNPGSKFQEAKRLNVPVITEERFLKMLETADSDSNK